MLKIGTIDQIMRYLIVVVSRQTSQELILMASDWSTAGQKI